MSSRADHVTMETVFGQTLALWLGDGDEHRPLESDTTGLNVKGNLYFTYKRANQCAKHNVGVGFSTLDSYGEVESKTCSRFHHSH